MRHAWLLAAVICFVLSASVRADDGITAEIAQINTAKYPEVTLYVSVVDRAGQIVEGLAQEDFRITEDGVPIEIIAFSAGSHTAIAAVLTIDRSGSMGVEGKLEGAKSAATTFVDLMRAQDRAALIAFESKVMTLQPFTSDKAALKAQIRSLRANGCTAWYDAVYRAVELIAPLDGRRSVILLSDGIDCREDLVRRLMDEGSSHDLDEAIQRARSVGIPVYAIGLGQRATQTVGNEGFDEVKLRRVASETGGRFYHAPNAAELKQLYSSLATTMQKEYTLTYRSPRPTYDGTRRNIVVTVRRGSGPATTTRGRYLEQHLVNIRSDLRLFLAFLLPLLLLLVAPPILQRGKERAREKGEQAGPERAEALPKAAPEAGAAPVGPALEAALPQQGMPGASAIPSPAPAPAVTPEPQPPAAPAPTPGAVPPPRVEPAPARLVVRYPLGPGETPVGRAADNVIVLSDPSVAAHHACIAVQAGRYIVRDLSNGQTYVSYRGDPLQERPTGTNALRDGSTIRFGQVRSVLRQPADSNAGVWLELSLALQAPVTLGRDPGNHVVVNAAQVAPRQAEIRQEAGRWVVADLGDGGTTRVSFSGDPARSQPVQGRNALKVGSRIYVGDVMLELQA